MHAYIELEHIFQPQCFKTNPFQHWYNEFKMIKEYCLLFDHLKHVFVNANIFLMCFICKHMPHVFYLQKFTMFLCSSCCVFLHWQGLKNDTALKISWFHLSNNNIYLNIEWRDTKKVAKREVLYTRRKCWLILSLVICSGY